jgi:hypothetical protein
MPSLFFPCFLPSATNGVCCKYAAIISIINLGLVVRESKYPKSIYFELYSLRLFCFLLDLLRWFPNDTHDFAI